MLELGTRQAVVLFLHVDRNFATGHERSPRAPISYENTFPEIEFVGFGLQNGGEYRAVAFLAVLLRH